MTALAGLLQTATTPTPSPEGGISSLDLSDLLTATITGILAIVASVLVMNRQLKDRRRELQEEREHQTTERRQDEASRRLRMLRALLAEIDENIHAHATGQTVPYERATWNEVKTAVGDLPDAVVEKLTTAYGAGAAYNEMKAGEAYQNNNAVKNKFVDARNALAPEAPESQPPDSPTSSSSASSPTTPTS